MAPADHHNDTQKPASGNARGRAGSGRRPPLEWSKLPFWRRAFASALLLLALPYYLLDREVRRLDAETSLQISEENLRGGVAALRDGRVYYELAGPENGEPVVLVNGLASPLFTWDHVFDGLGRRGYRVLRYDLYGRGRSERPRAVYGSDIYQRQLDDLLLAVGGSFAEQPVHIIALSMGGCIVTRFAERRPEKLRRTALVAPAGFPLSLPISARIAHTPLLGDYVVGALGNPILLNGLHRNVHRPELLPGYRNRFTPQMQFYGFKAALLSSLRHMPLRSLESNYPQAFGGRELLLLWGREDRIVPVAIARKMRESIPNSRLVVLEEAGHLPHWERHERAVPVLAAHLAGRLIEETPLESLPDPAGDEAEEQPGNGS